MRRHPAITVFLLLFFLLAQQGFGQPYLVSTFTNRSKDPTLDWVGECLAEAIREGMAAARVGVVAREDREEATRRLALRPSSQLTLASVVRLGRELAVKRAFYGRFDVVPDSEKPASRGRIRVLARVLDLETSSQVTEFVVMGSLEDLALVAGDLAWQALRWAQPSNSLSREQFRERHPSVKINALENYVRGLMAQTTDSQHRFFTQAARTDPSFASPRFFLGRMHFEKENYREAAGWLEKVPPENFNYVDANFYLGLSRYELSEFDGARRAFERVAAALPAAEVWNNMGAADARLNRPEALDSFRKALDAEPRDPDYHFNVGYALWKRGDFDAAAERFRAVLERAQDDEDAVLLLKRCQERSGPRRGDVNTEGLERLKESYTEQTPRASAAK